MILNWTDYGIIAFVAISILLGLIRGFVREALSLITWGLAFWLGFTFSQELAPYMTFITKTPNLCLALAFAALFITTLLLGALVNLVMSQLVKKTGLSGSDRVLGMVFGFCRGGAVVVVLLLVAGLSSIPQTPWWKESLLIQHFKPAAQWLIAYVPKNLEFNLG